MRSASRSRLPPADRGPSHRRTAAPASSELNAHSANFRTHFLLPSFVFLFLSKAADWPMALSQLPARSTSGGEGSLSGKPVTRHGLRPHRLTAAFCLVVEHACASEGVEPSTRGQTLLFGAHRSEGASIQLDSSRQDHHGDGTEAGVVVGSPRMQPEQPQIPT